MYYICTYDVVELLSAGLEIQGFMEAHSWCADCYKPLSFFIRWYFCLSKKDSGSSFLTSTDHVNITAKANRWTLLSVLGSPITYRAWVLGGYESFFARMIPIIGNCPKAALKTLLQQIRQICPWSWFFFCTPPLVHTERNYCTCGDFIKNPKTNWIWVGEIWSLEVCPFLRVCPFLISLAIHCLLVTRYFLMCSEVHKLGIKCFWTGRRKYSSSYSSTKNVVPLLTGIPGFLCNS